MERRAALLLKWIMRVELVVACGSLAFAAGSICADVLARQFFHQGFYGVQNVAVYCCAVAGALGLSIVVHGGGHLRITAIDSLYPPDQLYWVSRIGDLVSAALFILLAWFATRFVASTFAFGETDIVLQLPIWPIQVVLPVTFAVAAFKCLVHAIYPGIKPEEAAVG